MIPSDARPRLAVKVRLKFDRHSQRHMLVYPDRGMLLNASSAAILELCTGERTVAEIVARLHAQAGYATRAEVERDVHAFLESLKARLLIRVEE
jgi:pyrroloquinoline quinone biosynthesis protein D